MMMERDDYLRRAAEVEAKAPSMSDPRRRARMLELAEEWRALGRKALRGTIGDPEEPKV